VKLLAHGIAVQRKLWQQACAGRNREAMGCIGAYKMGMDCQKNWLKKITGFSSTDHRPIET
jgi:hypothetical protein